MSEKTIAFVKELVNAFPGLQPWFDEHVKHNFGEVLSYIFMADVELYARELFERSRRSQDADGRKAAQELEALFAFLEQGFVTDPQVNEMVSVSFLEHLPLPNEQGSEIRNLVGPRMAKQLKRIR